MIDLVREKLIPLNEAAKLLPTRPSNPTFWRWRSKGVRGRKLETVRVGGRVYTSAEALARFAVQEGGADEPRKLRSPRERERAYRRAERELADEGIAT